MSLFSTPRLRAFTLGLLAVPAMLCGTALSGCDADGLGSQSEARTAPTAASLTAQAPHAALDGEALFTGLLLGEGPAAAYLPEVWENKEVRQSAAESSDAYNEMTAFIVQTVRSQSPDFFDAFGSQMQSGDHVQVQAAFERAGTEIALALSSHPDSAVRAIVESGLDGDVPRIVGETEQRAVAIFVVVVVLLLWVVVPVISEEFRGGAIVDLDRFPGLQREQLIHTLTLRLAPAPATRR